MPTVAEQLRTAREARNLTIQQVAEITKLRSDQVQSLEEGDYEVFSAPVYIRGFVRTYSTLLKLDVPSVMAALDEELNQTSRFSEPPPLTEKTGLVDTVMLTLSQMDWRKGAVGLGLIALLVVVISMYFSSGSRPPAEDPLKGVKPAMYGRTQAVAGDVLPLPSGGKR